ncbi:MAG TPA: DUF2652 domain-containing protein [Candidatus Dormibacteraeota bacterium]|nr:DUF2652 domain-containing protein [Candidatus Dormibacteraeota bacterium]
MIAPSTIETSILLLADISGYTSFLEAVQEAHPEMTQPGGSAAPAYQIVSSLLETVMTHIAPSFSLLQVEGDALFARGPDRQLSGNGTALVTLVRSAYQAFRQQLGRGMDQFRHNCQACMILPSLDLKFIAHRGIAIQHRIAGRDVLAGAAVNVAHRLLKNSISARTGLRAYCFVTDAAAESLGLAAILGQPYVEDYPDIGRISGLLIALQP